MPPPYDPRAVANLLLDLADEHGRAVSNLVLQKLLYFAHAHFLVENKQPLIQGAFEAWKHGPVHPAVYQSFKIEGNRSIKVRAVAHNVMTGETQPIKAPVDPRVGQYLLKVLSGYAHLSPAQLVELSHARRGPWDVIVNKSKTSIALGMRIPDSVTSACFMYLKLAIGSDIQSGELDEDAPLI